MTLLSLSLLSLLGCGAQGVQPVSGPPDEPPRALTLQATARLNVPPDSACVRLTFSEERGRMVDAHAAVRAHRARFLSAIEALGVEVEEGATLYTPNYSHDGGTRTLHGYEATITLDVHTHTPSQVPEIIERAGDGLHGVTVTHYARNLNEHRERVRQMAIEAARRKAEQLARGFEVELGGVVRLSEAQASTGRYGGLDNAVGNISVTVEEETERGPAPPGSVPLSMTLHVTFALEG